MESFVADDGYVLVRLDPGDLVLESIRTAIAEHNIETGIVVAGIGTFKNLNIHYVHTTDFPRNKEERNTQLQLDGAWEVTSLQGIIAGGEPHLHISAFDGERTLGGHLEEGCTVHILMELAIRKLSGPALTRRPNHMNVSTLQNE